MQTVKGGFSWSVMDFFFYFKKYFGWFVIEPLFFEFTYITSMSILYDYFFPYFHIDRRQLCRVNRYNGDDVDSLGASQCLINIINFTCSMHYLNEVENIQ